MRQRILLVEDNPDWREEIIELLSDRYRFIEADSVGQARSSIDDVSEGLKVDIVILDLELSRTVGIDSGLSVLKYLRQKLPDIPCIVFTGQELSMDRANSLYRDYNIMAGLAKPMGILQLPSTISDILASGQKKTPFKSVESKAGAMQPEDIGRDTYLRLLSESFNDDELVEISFAYFPEVYDGFTDNMTRRAKMLSLLDYCVRRNQLDKLLEIVRERNPSKYEEILSH